MAFAKKRMRDEPDPRQRDVGNWHDDPDEWADEWADEQADAQADAMRPEGAEG